MARKNQIRLENLSRLIVYILGYRPDEFGLIPDREGYVSSKELLWAIHEEAGMGYVRQGHIDEVLMGKDRALFEKEKNRIRYLKRQWDFGQTNPVQGIQKILYTTVRRRAHAHALDKGLKSVPGKYLVLSREREMALRIGKRTDPKPVLLEIRAAEAQRKGCEFYLFGSLYLTDALPVEFITGPPLPKETAKEPRAEDVREEGRITNFEAGTFVLEMPGVSSKGSNKKGKKRKGWKEEARKHRKRREP